jgi:inosine-uridine nucleoside N-ribohydrolase
LRDPSRPVDVLALGALTHIADALERHSRLPAHQSLVIMGGAVVVTGNVNGVGKSENTTAEWNRYVDPGAGRRVLAAGLPVPAPPNSRSRPTSGPRSRHRTRLQAMRA